MRIVVFGPERRVGVVVGENVLDLNRADTDLPSTLLPFIEGGDAVLQRAQRAIDRAQSAPDAALQPMSEVKLRAPWPGRRAMMAGTNIATHIAGGAGDLAEVIRKQREIGQRGFWKVHLEPIDPDDCITRPKRTRYLDYEGEPAIIVGKQVKDARAADIRDLVWGVTLSNDICIRDEGGNPGARFAFDKNFDGSFTLGPSIVIGEVDFEDMPVETRVNGEVRQSFSSKDMIFSFGEMLEFATRDFTFSPGDLISGGTGGGTALDSTPAGPDGNKSTERFLKPGDVVEVMSPAVGTLRHHII